MVRSRFASPGYAVMGMGVGHAIWGWAAYRSSLGKIVRAGYIDSVGDGLFRKDHSKDERAAAFWFMAVAPLVVLAGYMGEAAVRAEDRRALTTAGVSTTLLGVAGMAAIPRSGFPAALVLGPWMIRRARQLDQ